MLRARTYTTRDHPLILLPSLFFIHVKAFGVDQKKNGVEELKVFLLSPKDQERCKILIGSVIVSLERYLHLPFHGFQAPFSQRVVTPASPTILIIHTHYISASEVSVSNILSRAP
jgi:hypothetical protein